jgi:hypothetical protein
VVVLRPTLQEGQKRRLGDMATSCSRWPGAFPLSSVPGAILPASLPYRVSATKTNRKQLAPPDCLADIVEMSAARGRDTPLARPPMSICSWNPTASRSPAWLPTSRRGNFSIILGERRIRCEGSKRRARLQRRFRVSPGRETRNEKCP